MNRLHAALAAMATAVALAAPTATTYARYATVDTVDLSRPGSLGRGAEADAPHVEGSTLVDGDLRIELGTTRAMLVGPSGEGYVVHTWGRRFGRDQVKRVTAEGDITVLLRGRQAWSAMLSSDGEQILTNDNKRRATITAYDATDGSEIADGRFRGHGFVVDVRGGTAVVSLWERDRTVAWDVTTGERRRVSDHAAYGADLAADRLAVYTRDPYLDGCSVVSAVSAPDEVLWRSCRQKVLGFSPDGARLTTAHILSDGVGPGEVQLRRSDGTLLTRYRANWFGEVRWEDADTLLLDANGRRRGATVRCRLADCERASDLAVSTP